MRCNLDGFSEEQKQYLQGFSAGAGIAQRATFAGTLGLKPEQLPGGASGPRAAEQICYDAQDRQTADGKKLCNEEIAKRKRFPLDVWDDIGAHASRNEPPKGTDVLAFKYYGIFWVAPAQDSFMSRLRFAGGIVQAYQLRGIANLADQFGGGYSDVTTRANLQVRQITPANTVRFLEGIYDLGILNRGSGADNVRNITASPLAGIDPQELIDTRTLAKELHHLILNRRELFGLPRKFNIAFDGGGQISALEDTNDIGFSAVRINDPTAGEPEVYFRLTLGGITGHKDFARDTGIALKPEECLDASVAILKAFILHGDRTDRKKARLKYVLDRMGFDGFIQECEKLLGKPFRRLPLNACEARAPVGKHTHVGVRPQRQDGRSYIGVVLPVGRMTADQMRALAGIADRYGSGHIRLTVWQNLIVPDIRDEDIDTVVHAIEQVGLTTNASSVRGGLVACTGSAGCKFANADTKKHGLEIADYLESRLELDQPVNIHLTGCPHSCAQHFIGDIGLLGTKVSVGEEMLEGYHIFVGGGYATDQAIGRELFRNVLATDCAQTIERMLLGYLAHRTGDDQSFNDFVRSHPTEDLVRLFEQSDQLAGA
ncbi:MAG: NirA family protein [Burkholderiales bacterium]|nr:NirA family protein [Phycisphaerae bacterium]